ncbi:hypothetical protein CFELI_13070 [Corynebacterium felinum]|uniref:Transposase n=1 Tax=Corynebacterium felinum TaxID=131318 RepID=A0ABU2B9F9_9CORY|nr:hypothetical protein [Corynebacterium felinum]WJY96193.1 hypothetical protein CFELI_13070 [Corynebacterium felinum]
MKSMNTNTYTITRGLNISLPLHALKNLRKNPQGMRVKIRKLACTQAIDSEVFQRLPPSSRNLMRCYAVASTSRTAVLVGRAAACF